MDQTLKMHEDMIDKHEVKLEDIKEDLTDIKVRLGIKDLTNGQVVEYQEKLVDAIEEEKNERKEQDAIIRNYVKSVDDRTWTILVAVIFAIVLEIASLVWGALL